MGLNKSKGNMYEWITHTWNAIKGRCPHDCSYCYMKRWDQLKEIRLDKKELKTDLSSGNYIFVGSSCDMFANDIPAEWIIRTLEHCSKFDNKYLFQSKNPANFDLIRTFRMNYTLCTTIETNRVYPEIMRNAPDPGDRATAMGRISGRKYVTIEPIMDFDLGALASMIRYINPIQVNIGGDSGKNNLPEPSTEKIRELIELLKHETNIKLKKNLNRLL